MRIVPLMIVAAVLLVHAPVHGESPESRKFDSGKVDFKLRFGDESTSFKILATSVLPGAGIDLSVVPGRRTSTFRMSAAAGTLEPKGDGAWQWTAPETPGLAPLVLTREGDGATITLHVFVLVPANRVKDGVLNGYRIGEYPKIPLRGLDIYRPPVGYIEVTPENQDTPVSPHFVLRQFLCKQSGGWPKYILLRTMLLRKLEFILERTNAAGHPASSFFIMSGYRTPHYNASLGNVKYSRHMWGGAVDIFIDEKPRDGMMDDLNGDGRIDVNDAAVMYGIVDGLVGEEDYDLFIGGLGRYRRNASHGPFIHVDARGFRARWGD